MRARARKQRGPRGPGRRKQATSEWLAFRIKARGEAFTATLADFKAVVPSTSRRWDSEHRYWVFAPQFAEAVSDIRSGVVEQAISFREDDRRYGRTPVTNRERLDTDLIDRMY